MTSRATVTGILVKRVLISKDTVVTSRSTFCSLRDLANPLLSLTKKSIVEEFWLGIWLICKQMCSMLILWVWRKFWLCGLLVNHRFLQEGFCHLEGRFWCIDPWILVQWSSVVKTLWPFGFRHGASSKWPCSRPSPKSTVNWQTTEISLIGWTRNLFEKPRPSTANSMSLTVTSSSQS